MDRNDPLDAMVLALSAKFGSGDFEKLCDCSNSEAPLKDEKGLRMQLVYAESP